MNEKTGSLLAVAALVIAAIVFGVIGVKDLWFLSRSEMTNGTIDDVVKTTTHGRRGRHRTHYRVSYSYTVDGKAYQETDSLSHSVSTGPARIYYDSADPGDGRIDKPSPAITFALAIAALIGAVLSYFKARNAAG